MRRNWLVLSVIIAAPGCTSVGAWMYQDPSYSLQAVSLRKAEMTGGTKDSVELMFIGCNLNDFDITETSFLTKLAIGGQSAGEGDHGSTIYLGTRGEKQFSVVVPLATEALPEDQAMRPFEVLAVSQVKTPIGDRAIPVKMAGEVTRTGEQLNWRMKPQACKPGTSTLPASFDTRPIPPEIQRDRPQGIPQPGLNAEPR
jgi:hypothetical protein